MHFFICACRPAPGRGFSAVGVRYRGEAGRFRWRQTGLGVELETSELARLGRSGGLSQQRRSVFLGGRAISFVGEAGAVGVKLMGYVKNRWVNLFLRGECVTPRKMLLRVNASL